MIFYGVDMYYRIRLHLTNRPTTRLRQSSHAVSKASAGVNEAKPSHLQAIYPSIALWLHTKFIRPSYFFEVAAREVNTHGDLKRGLRSRSVLTLMRSLSGNMRASGEPVVLAHAMQKPEDGS
jgi:hypothetical protein